MDLAFFSRAILKGVQMNEEYFEQIRNLCKAFVLSIDKIARQFNINQNLVAKLFMKTMQIILSEVEE